MSITALDIARGFNFDGIDPAVHLSEFLVDHWGTLSADDRYLVTQHLWDGLNNYVDFVKTGMGNRGATPEEVKKHVDAMTPIDGTKWKVPEGVLFDTWVKITRLLRRSYDLP